MMKLILITFLSLLSFPLGLSMNKMIVKSFSSLLLISSLQLPIIPLSVKAKDDISYYLNAKDFYNSWNNKDIEKAITYFSDDIIFNDAQYDKPFIGKNEVKNYLQECADSLTGWSFIIDDYAEDINGRKVGLKWHVSDSSNIPLPFPNKGISFLKFNENGLITECNDMVEPTVKTGSFQLPLLRVVSKLLNIK